ncbi:hypothetical protein Y032_0004g1762 [Ancylostoma ceylanicum]|uniref:Uncharacterized protein n=1 Tax=Ancylostoma ceylanicum TaxID=53326 RepID=A0A016VVH4_9BILA|nr:hypothetical protein Y032_0004g1762 [Ancylostoma ceylanicum]
MLYRQVQGRCSFRRRMPISSKVLPISFLLNLNTTLLYFSGNIVNSNVYQVGNPCTMRPAGTSGCDADGLWF